MNKTEIKTPIEPNDDSFINSIMKMIVYLGLLILNIIVYYRVTSLYLGEVPADLLFAIVLVLLILNFKITHRWKYDWKNEEILVTLQSNVLNHNVVKIFVNSELKCENKHKSTHSVTVNVDFLNELTKVNIFKNDENQILCCFS